MNWRAANPTDDDEIVDMFVALNREDPGQDPVPAAHMRRTLVALREAPERGRTVVLEVDGRRLGYALLISFWSNELGGACCSVDELFVRAEARSHGHAAALFDTLRAGSPLWPTPFPALLLEVSPKNTRALALYRRCGFRGENLCLRAPVDAAQSD